MENRVYRMLINGQLLSTGEAFGVLNPATGKQFASAPTAALHHVEEALDSAREGFRVWSATPQSRRSEMLLRAASLLEENRTDLELLLSKEQGKPLPSAVAETNTAIGSFRAVADLILPTKIIKETPTHFLTVRRKPVGVVLAITPWNYPLGIGCGKIARALGHGNSVILKPSPFTPLTSLFMGELLQGVFPAGVLNVVSGDGSVGAQLVESPKINLVSFTGSVLTGKRIMAACANNMTRVLLELGGNDPAIVLPDADVLHAAKGIFAMSMNNSGQICCAVKRVYVHDSLHDSFVREVVRLAEEAVMSIGEGTTEGVKMGPLNNKPQLDRVIDLIADAVRNGGTLLAGGTPPPHADAAGFFLAPTIITNVQEGIRLVDEEQFGPVMPIMKYSLESEVVTRANDSQLGLGASVWGTDSVAVNRVANQLEAGIVWTNEHAVLREGGPFGGMKQSGFRREGDFAEADLDAYTEVQTIKIAKTKTS